MKVLVFGKNGQLGNQLFKDFGKDKNFIFLSRDQANFINLKQIEEIIYKIKPRVIISLCFNCNSLDALSIKRNTSLLIILFFNVTTTLSSPSFATSWASSSWC